MSSRRVFFGTGIPFARHSWISESGNWSFLHEISLRNTILSHQSRFYNLWSYLQLSFWCSADVCSLHCHPQLVFEFLWCCKLVAPHHLLPLLADCFLLRYHWNIVEVPGLNCNHSFQGWIELHQLSILENGEDKIRD